MRFSYAIGVKKARFHSGKLAVKSFTVKIVVFEDDSCSVAELVPCRPVGQGRRGYLLEFDKRYQVLVTYCLVVSLSSS